MALNSLNQRIPLRSSRYADSLYDFFNSSPATHSYCLPCWLRISQPKPQTRYVRRNPRSFIQGGRRTITTRSSPLNHDDQDAKPQPVESASPADTSHVLRPSEKLVKSALVRRREKRREYEEYKRNRTIDPEDYNSPMRINPWALILSSAPRMCSYTRARLPEKLMTGFGLVQHPETSALWLLPTTLQKDQLKKLNNNTASTDSKVDEGDEGHVAPDGKADGGGESVSSHTPRQKVPEMRILSSQRFLDTLSTPKGQGVVKGTIPTRWKETLGLHKKGTKNALKNIVWREDMPDHVLLQMRKKAVKTLKNIIGRGDSPVYERDTLKVLEGIEPTATTVPSLQTCLEDGLRKLGELPDMEKGVILINSTKQGESQNVPDLVDLPMQNTQVPVLDLGKLFAPSDLEELGNHHPVLKENALFLVPGRKKSAKVVMALWSLKLYLGD